MTQANIKQENSELITNSEADLKSEIFQEIEATPQEYWSNLLQIIRSFREAITAANKSKSTGFNLDTVEQSKKNKAASIRIITSQERRR